MATADQTLNYLRYLPEGLPHWLWPLAAALRVPSALDPLGVVPVAKLPGRLVRLHG